MLSSFLSTTSRARVSRCRGCGFALGGGECGKVFGLRRRLLAENYGAGVACYREADFRKSDAVEAMDAAKSSGRPSTTYIIDQFLQGSSKYSRAFRIDHRRFYSPDKRHDDDDDEVVKDSTRIVHGHSERAVVTALWCNFLVLALKCGVWSLTGSHVMLAEAVHSLADLANQGLLAYGLVSSRRAPDALHPYGYSKERFVWSLISAVGIFCLGSGATIVHGISNLWNAEPVDNLLSAAIVIGGSMAMEGASLYVAINAVRQGAAAEGMKFKEYIWRGHDPTSVAVMMEDGAAVTGLIIAAMSLTAVHLTGNGIWDPLGSILVGNLLGMVAIFLIQRNRHALLGRSMEPKDVQRVLDLLSSDPVVDAVYDCKSEVIGPGSYRFKAEIDFDGVVVVHNYLRRAGREAWIKEFQEAAKDPVALEAALANYGEEVVAALGSEVDRLEKDIQKIVPGVRHVDIEAHNPKDLGFLQFDVAVVQIFASTMAECLAWRDLSQEELIHIFDDSKTAADMRRHLGGVMKLNDGSINSEILLDLHYGSLYFAQEKGFSLEKISAFVSIVKTIHEQAVGMRLTVERSWEKAKSLFLLHSVQRPPFSIGLFSFGDLQEITRYVLNTYYRHFKLYQYAFCPTYYLNLDTWEYDLVELPPELKSLDLAITQEEYDIQQEALRKQQEEEEAKRLEEKRLADEAARQAKIEAEYRASIPDEITRKVNQVVSRYMDEMRAEFDAKLQQKMTELGAAKK